VALHTPVGIDVLELDVAKASIVSDDVLAAMVAHLELERRAGGYQAARQAAPALETARHRLAHLALVPGARVEFVGNGSDAVRLLVDAWPLVGGEAVLVPRSEFLSNRLALDRLAGVRGIEVVELAEDGTGRLDPATVEAAARRHRVGLVVLSHVQSQRGVVQPLDDVLKVAATAEVPVLVDVCQSLGHVPSVPGAAAVAGTSRKWLHGPRGVGFVAVDPVWWERLDAPATLHSHLGSGTEVRADPAISLFEAPEAPVAARVGLATAVGQLLETGPEDVLATLAAKGRRLRELLVERVPGLPLGEPVEEPSAIVTIHPRGNGVAAAIADALEAAGVRAGVVPAGRALDTAWDVARLAPAPWVPDAGLELAADVVARALRAAPNP
jgi:pyridoxal 5-phosphate dependent beta-lyase